jgi:uncharacterized membrane-anchored protein
LFIAIPISRTAHQHMSSLLAENGVVVMSGNELSALSPVEIIRDGDKKQQSERAEVRDGQRKYEAQANTDTKEPNDNLKDRQHFDLTFTATVE